MPVKDIHVQAAHSVLRWLPTKLAKCIGDNLQDELRLHDKADQRAEHVVDGALATFGCVEWESELCRGVMRARCYPFDIPKHCFHGMNPSCSPSVNFW
jgi:hypothetical protein